jgi:cell wall-associated NlpC family hydrolase
MKFKKILRIILFLIYGPVLLTLTQGCKQPAAYLFSNEIDSIGLKWVPDKREGIFDASLYSSGNDLILKGETDVKEARRDVTDFLKSRGVIFIDSLALLPDSALVKEQWGLVNVSNCNIRSATSYSAEITSQALMGTPVRILKKEAGWFLIQTPDRYIGWTDSDIIVTMNNEDYSAWKSSPRIFFTDKTGDIYKDTGKRKVISDVVGGCILKTGGRKNGDYAVTLPDGRTGLIPENKAILLDELTVSKYLKAENLVSTAESLTGIPYLWGGTSVKGLDCSGFTKTVYYLNGIILARDASLQFRHGTEINKTAGIDSFKAGDLLFFGSVRDGKPKPTHVAMYIGDTEYINSSGMVRVNSLDSTRANFSKYRKNSLLGVRRIIGAAFDNGIQPVAGHNWYK